MNKEEISQLPKRILDEVSKVIIGKSEVKEVVAVALIARGHVLIEGFPGTAKTKLAEAFAIAMGGEFKRIQFTPDMMPADITGFFIYSPDGATRLVKGPIFCNVVLADELNRTTPRTQSALLEAMGEYQVSIEGVTHPLPRPFTVIATQVGLGGEGTYPLTEVQIDRFLMRSLSQYPSRNEEKEVISRIDYLDAPDIKQVADGAQLEALQAQARKVFVADSITEYILDIIEGLRNDPDVSAAPSPRGSIALYKCSRARALLEGRDFVIPDDIKHLAPFALGHRTRVKPEAEMDGVTPEMLLARTLERVAVPKVEV